MNVFFLVICIFFCQSFREAAHVRVLLILCLKYLRTYHQCKFECDFKFPFTSDKVKTGNTFFHLFTFSLCLSFDLKCISFRQHIDEPFYSFNPFCHPMSFDFTFSLFNYLQVCPYCHCICFLVDFVLFFSSLDLFPLVF